MASAAPACQGIAATGATRAVLQRRAFQCSDQHQILEASGNEQSSNVTSQSKTICFAVLIKKKFRKALKPRTLKILETHRQSQKTFTLGRRPLPRIAKQIFPAPSASIIFTRSLLHFVGGLLTPGLPRADRLIIKTHSHYLIIPS